MGSVILPRFLIFIVFLLVACSQIPEPAVETAIPPTIIPSPTTTPTELILPSSVPTDTAVPNTPTPFPTPTNTPEPTPIVYQIQEGETLLGIAIDQGTTTEAILALNPDLRPEALQIGQAIILPPKTTDNIVDVVANTSIPTEILVYQTQSYETSVGGFWVIGEVENKGAEAVENVQVQIRFLDDQGNELDTAVTWVVNPIIQAGGKAPFGILLPQKPPFAQIDTAVIGGNLVAEMGERYIDLQLTELNFNTEKPALQLNGVVENGGDAEAIAIQVIFSLYDAENDLVGFTIYELDDSLPVGAAAGFSETAVPLRTPVESVTASLFAYKLVTETQ